MKRAGVRSVIGFLLVAAVVAPGPAAGDTDLDRVVANLQKRQEQVTGFRVRVEGTRFVPKGGETDHAPPMHADQPPVWPLTDQTTELKQEFTLDFAAKKHRLLYEERCGDKFDSWIRVLNGGKLYGSKLDIPIDQMAGVRPESMSIVSGGEQVHIYTSRWWPYFMSHGYVLTSLTQPYRTHDPRVPIDRENLFVHRQEVFRGQPCDILRTFPSGPKKAEQFYEYAIGRDDAVVRRMTHWLGDRKVIEMTIDYARAGGRPVPTGWVNEWYADTTRRVWMSEKLQVKVCEPNPALSDESFTLTPKPGAVVKGREATSGPVRSAKDTAETVRYYQADEAGRLVEGELVDGQFRPRKRSVWWWVGGGGLLAVLAAALVYRRIRSGGRPAADPPPNATGGTT